MTDTMLNRKEVCKYLAISPSTLDRWKKAGDFPKEIRFGSKKIFWKKSIIDAWVESKVRQN